VEKDFKIDSQGKIPSFIHIMILSASGTITQSLALLVEVFAKKRGDIKLSVLESRPNFEGVAFVNRLFDLFANYREIPTRLKIEVEVTRSWPTAYVKSLNKKKQEGYQVEVKNTYFEWCLQNISIIHFRAELFEKGGNCAVKCGKGGT